MLRVRLSKKWLSSWLLLLSWKCKQKTSNCLLNEELCVWRQRVRHYIHVGTASLSKDLFLSFFFLLNSSHQRKFSDFDCFEVSRQTMEDIRLIISLIFKKKCSIFSFYFCEKISLSFDFWVCASFNEKENFFTLVIKLIHLKKIFK